MTHDLDREIAALARRTHGAFARSQAVALGATRAMIDNRVTTGRWEVVHRGVYRIAGTSPTWTQRSWAALLASGVRAVLSHDSALFVFELGGAPTHTFVTVPRERRIRVPGIVAHQASLEPRERTQRQGVPVTVIERTLVDVAPEREVEVVDDLIDECVRRGLTSAHRLRRYLAAASVHPGNAIVRRSMQARDRAREKAGSALEAILLRAMAVAGLPPPVSQHVIRDGYRFIARVDFAYPELKLAIEADGYQWHSGRSSWERDLARRNLLTSLGWLVLHITWGEVHADPAGVVHAIRSAIGIRRAARPSGSVHGQNG